MATFEIRILGPFGVTRDGGELDPLHWPRRAQRLLKLLATAPAHRRLRDELIELLWPDASLDSGASNLRGAVLDLRRALGEVEPTPILIEHGLVALQTAHTWIIDLDRFETLLAKGDEAQADAVELIRGEPLPEDRYEDWATPIRERVQRVARDAVIRLVHQSEQATGTRLSARESSERALRWLEMLRHMDPLDEAVLRLQLQALAGSGRRAEALRAYREFEERLRNELELEPEDETVAVAAALRDAPAQRRDRLLKSQGDAGTRDGVTPPQAPNNLPAPVTAFIGRRAHLERLQDVLATPSTRLLTLIGPGGTGKTRLALELGRLAVESQPDGVYFVNLAPLTDAALVPSAIASALGVQEGSSQGMWDAVASAIKGRRLLLILDNFEHVLGAGLQVSELLAACPQLRILVTSRERLHLYGERLYPVSPLSVPEDAELGAIDDLARSESVALFVDRAQAADPAFELSDRNAAAVVAMCRRLDGLPLAIELAAARASTFPPDVLLQRLNRVLDEVGTGPRDLPARQQTLRAATEWSYRLLSEPAQAVLARLSVFAGGCTAMAAEEVCGTPGQTQLPAELENLTEKSLLRREATAEPRFWMLDTIRAYALELLGARGEEEESRERHASYFRQLARRAEPELTGDNQALWLDRLELEHDNLRAALAWSRDRADDGGVPLAADLWRFWYARGYLSEGRSWLEQALAGSRPPEGAVAGTQGPEVELHRARALNGAGNLALLQGRYDDAQRFHEQSLEIRRRLGDERGVAASLNNLGTVASRQGNLDHARMLFEESLATVRRLGDTQRIATALNNVAITAQRQGLYGPAQELHEESLRLKQKIGDLAGISAAYDNLGGIASLQGEYERAEELYEKGLQINRELGNAWGIANATANLANAAELRGQRDKACVLYGESLTVQLQIGDREGIALCLLSLARIAASDGDPEQAVRLLGAATAAFEAITTGPDSAQEFEKIAGAARKALEAQAYARAWEQGLALAPERAAMEFGLASTPAPLAP